MKKQFLIFIFCIIFINQNINAEDSILSKTAAISSCIAKGIIAGATTTLVEKGCPNICVKTILLPITALLTLKTLNNNEFKIKYLEILSCLLSSTIFMNAKNWKKSLDNDNDNASNDNCTLIILMKE